MKRYQTHKQDRTNNEQDLPREAKTEIDMSEVDALLNDVDCCIAEVEQHTDAVEQKILDDEAAARAAMDNLIGRLDNETINYGEYKTQANLLQIRYAHTEYIRSRACCVCGCPWDE